MLQSHPARRDRAAIATATSVAVPAGLTTALLVAYLTSSYVKPSGLMLAGIVGGVIVTVGVIVYCRLTHVLGEIEDVRDHLDSKRLQRIEEITENVSPLRRD